MITLLSSVTFIYCVLVFAIIGITIALEVGSEGTATTLLSVALVLIFWNYGSNILEFINTNYVQVICFTIAYVLMGVIWSFLKWNYKVKNIFKKFGKIKNDVVSKHGELSEIKNLRIFNDYITRQFDKSDNTGRYSVYSDETLENTIINITPNADAYKTSIIAWISYWPLSLVGTLVNNPFKNFFNWVYESVSNRYDKLTQNQIKNYVK